jgi:hypothetical protein
MEDTLPRTSRVELGLHQDQAAIAPRCLRLPFLPYMMQLPTTTKADIPGLASLSLRRGSILSSGAGRFCLQVGTSASMTLIRCQVPPGLRSVPLHQFRTCPVVPFGPDVLLHVSARFYHV